MLQGVNVALYKLLSTLSQNFITGHMVNNLTRELLTKTSPNFQSSRRMSRN